MFTGIIKATGKIKQGNDCLEIEILENIFQINVGDSIAVDGICLTAKNVSENKFTVDVSEETLKKTTLGEKLILNSIVNLEPALKLSDRLGGHIVSGHVDGLGEVKNIEKLEKSWLLSIQWKNKEYSKYIVNKGSICVNGISLTIAANSNNGMIFTIAVIPHTWFNTNLQYLTSGQAVNLEADTLIKYVEKLIIFNQGNNESLSSELISSKWLKENGWDN